MHDPPGYAGQRDPHSPQSRRVARQRIRIEQYHVPGLTDGDAVPAGGAISVMDPSSIRTSIGSAAPEPLSGTTRTCRSNTDDIGVYRRPARGADGIIRKGARVPGASDSDGRSAWPIPALR